MKKAYSVQLADWFVKTERPEDLFKSPAEFYTREEAERYAKSNAMRTIQERLTLRALQLLNLPRGSKILDAGIGTGFSAAVARKAGYKVVGFDASPEMVRLAKKAGFKVKLGDFRKIPFPANSFDGIISITALQWLLTHNVNDQLDQTHAEFFRVLKPGGRGVAHFFPKSLAEAKWVLRTFQLSFDAKLVIDNPENARKRRVFLVFEKRFA